MSDEGKTMKTKSNDSGAVALTKGLAAMVFSLSLGCSGGGEPGAGKADAGGGEEEPAKIEASLQKAVIDKGAPKKAEATDTAQWTDEAGNYIKFEDQPELVNPDIVAVEVGSGEGELVVVYRFAEGNLEKCFRQKQGDPPLHFGSGFSQLYLDVDNDPATGLKIGRAENEQGYELKISVMTGFGFVNQDSGAEDAMFGDVGFPEQLTPLKPDASLTPWGLDPRTESFAFWAKFSSAERDDLPRQKTVLGKDQIVVSLPYDWFGMKAGDIVRLAYTDEKSSNDGMSEVRRVKLR